MRRCCLCHRTFGPAEGLQPSEYTDGYCARCWPGVLIEAGMTQRPYPGLMTEDKADQGRAA